MFFNDKYYLQDSEALNSSVSVVFLTESSARISSPSLFRITIAMKTTFCFLEKNCFFIVVVNGNRVGAGLAELCTPGLGTEEVLGRRVCTETRSGIIVLYPLLSGTSDEVERNGPTGVRRATILRWLPINWGVRYFSFRTLMEAVLLQIFFGSVFCFVEHTTIQNWKGWRTNKGSSRVRLEFLLGGN